MDPKDFKQSSAGKYIKTPQGYWAFTPAALLPQIDRTIKKVPESTHRLCEEIFLNPVVSISTLSKKWQMPFYSVKTGVNRLIKLGILREEPDRQRNRLFIANELMKLLTGTDELRR